MSDSELRRRTRGSGENMRAGYVPVDEEYLQQSGIRGCKSCCLWTGVVILLIVAIANATVTAGLVYLLSITHEGMTSIEFLPWSGHLRTLQDVHVQNLNVEGDIIGKENHTLMVTGTEIELGRAEGAKLYMDPKRLVLTSKDFELRTSTGKKLFTPDMPFTLPVHQVKNLHAEQIVVGEVKSRDGVDGIHIECNQNIDVVGMEGVNIEAGHHIDVQAEGEINILSLQGSVQLNSVEGTFLTGDLPTDGKDVDDGDGVGQYKLCICVHTGKLFTVPYMGPDSGCHALNEVNDPCVD